MIVTIDDAIHAMSLLRDEVNENGFLHECYNLSISALKTVKDGNYSLAIPNHDISYEDLVKIADYPCVSYPCEDCMYKLPYSGMCASNLAGKLLRYNEFKQWYDEHKSEV